MTSPTDGLQMDVESAGKMVEIVKQVEKMLCSSEKKNTLSKTTAAFVLTCGILMGRNKNFGNSIRAGIHQMSKPGSP